MSKESESLSIVVVGASGDLARRKLFPSLFSLYCQGRLPKDFHVFGFARSHFENDAFRHRITEHLTCRYAEGESCAARMEEFLGRCHYVSGDYDATDAFLDLFIKMRDAEGGAPTRRLYYLAVPPSVFLDVARSIGNAGLVACGNDEPWSRVVLEKPFGRDRESSDALTEAMSQVFMEHSTYRIDHYLGKEVIQNLMVLRFANVIFEPMWNRQFIHSVRIRWKEDLGLEGRGGYFDHYGIIRDVMQNHLLQILALVAMEPPRRLDAVGITAEKTRLLRFIPPVQADALRIGQYVAATVGKRSYPSYTDDPTVPDNSITPTYAAVKLAIDNWRWEGVPFYLEAGKGLDTCITEIRIRFRSLPGNMFCSSASGCPLANEMVIRVQPDEAIHLSITNKVPGMGMNLEVRNLDLQYKAAFTETIPDAYENLLLDVIQGDRSLFIQSEELEAAWDIFTPILHELEAKRQMPELYRFGSVRPAGAESLFA